MSELIAGATEQMTLWPPFWSYAILGFSAFLENVIPPVPGDTVVVFGAYLVGRGALDWQPVYAATSVGGTAGFMVMWYLGLTQGRSLIVRHPRVVRILSEKHLDRAQAWLDRYGLWLVVANRFLTGIRSAISLAAGMGRMRFRGVFLAALLGIMAWNGILLGAGLLVGRNWPLVLEWVSVYNRVGLAILALAVLAVGGRWWIRRRRRANQAAAVVDSLSESA